MPIWYAKRAFSAFDSPGRAGLQGDSKQRLRLWSGLVLMAYAATHLANHAVGLWSLAEMEAVRLWFTGFWRSLPGTVLLAGAASVHVVLALWKVAAGRTLRLPFWQWAQIALGLAIPLLLAEHVFGTRLSHEVFGLEDRYAYVLLSTWPEKNVTMAAMIAVVWLHGCLGVHYWARLYPTYRDVRGWFLSIAVLLPVLAYMGYASAGREVARLRAADPFWTGDLLRAIGFPGEEVSAFVAAGDRAATIGTIAIVVLIGSVRLGRAIAARRNQVPLTYPGQRRLRVPRGISVLEASQRAGIPHAAVCGGRGRCSTCRVRVGAGNENLPVPSEAERRVLRRIGAPPGVRLACQIPVTAPLEVTPLLPPASSPSAALGDDANRHGRERDLAVLFCDIRGFTAFSEHRLPYDVVFVLNRYFRAMSEQVQANGGYVDKFIGDGLMALFGLEADRATASRQAIAAVRSLAEGLERLNLELSDELDGPLQIGIGVHIGPVIVGELGHGRAASLTAIGDTVNVASRLEVMTKEHQCEAVISQDLADAAGISTDSLVHAELLIRGRSQPLSVVILPQAGDLSASA